MDIGSRVAELRHAHVPKLTQDDLADRTELSVDTVKKIEQGRRVPSLDALRQFATALRVPASALLDDEPAAVVVVSDTDELEALELSQRVAASDVGEETLRRLESSVDELARAYPVTQPAELIGRVRAHLRYVVSLVDAKKTLDEHRRLLTIGSWLSLLAGTLHIDLEQPYAAKARLRASLDLAKQAGGDDIIAWIYETRAYGALTGGDYASAHSLSTAAQEYAPRGSSIAVQAAAQEGRALARLGRVKETYATLERVRALVNPLDTPAHPEHHFTYDPNKAPSYFATTLAWLGDSAAEAFAREIITRLASVDGWPRRVASAKLDLGLILVSANRHDEAAAIARDAVDSGKVVPSNRWRAIEVIQAVEARGLPEAKDLREAYRDSQS